jgi:hypothetical protein
MSEWDLAEGRNFVKINVSSQGIEVTMTKGGMIVLPISPPDE